MKIKNVTKRILHLILCMSLAQANAEDELLFSCIQKDFNEAAAVLLQQGATPNAWHASLGCSALHFAVLHKNIHMIKMLTQAGADLEIRDIAQMTPLHFAAHMGRTREAISLICLNANPNTLAFEGWTALHYAAEQGHSEIVILLVASKAEINAMNEQGNTPLHLATKGNHLDTMRTLLACGAKPEVKNAQEEMPFHLAAKTSIEAAMLFLNYYKE